MAVQRCEPQPRRARGNRGQRRGAPPVSGVSGIVSPITESLSLSETPRTDSPPPLGFNYNRGPNFVHCPIALDGGRQQQAHFVWVDMGVDLRVVGRVRGSDVDYGAPLHAQPDYDAME